MELTEVMRVLDALDAENVASWVLGGWGVDALMSAAWQVRVHAGYEPRAQDLHDLAILDGLIAP